MANYDNIKDKGFDFRPENINRKGQPVSIKNQLKELMLNDGELPIPAKNFIKKKMLWQLYFFIREINPTVW